MKAIPSVFDEVNLVVYSMEVEMPYRVELVKALNLNTKG